MAICEWKPYATFWWKENYLDIQLMMTLYQFRHIISNHSNYTLYGIKIFYFVQNQQHLLQLVHHD